MSSDDPQPVAVPNPLEGLTHTMEPRHARTPEQLASFYECSCGFASTHADGAGCFNLCPDKVTAAIKAARVDGVRVGLEAATLIVGSCRSTYAAEVQIRSRTPAEIERLDRREL